jgi:hypothetical protein
LASIPFLFGDTTQLAGSRNWLIDQTGTMRAAETGGGTDRLTNANNSTYK